MLRNKGGYRGVSNNNPPLKEKIRESYTGVLIFPYFGAQILLRGAKPFPKIRLRRLVSRFKDKNQTVHEKLFFCNKKKVFARFWISSSSRGVRSSYLVTVPVITFTFGKFQNFFVTSTFFLILVVKKSSNFTNLTKTCEKI